MSAENNTDPGELPAGLPALTQVEEMIIARSHVQMLIHRYRGHQYRYSGHCVSFMQNTVKTVDILPNLPAELDIVVLRPADGVLETDQRYRNQFRTECKVRRGAIIEWLQYLKQNHPDYRWVQISTARIEALPQDDDVSSSFPTIIENIQPEEGPGNEPDPVELPPLNSQSMVLNLDTTTTEVELVLQGIAGRKPLPPGLPAPSIRQTPIDDAVGNERVFAMAFPTLYPTGKADFNNPRIRKVELRDYAQHLIRYQDGRFGRHPRWRFLIFNMIMRQRVFSTARFYVARNAGLKDLTREELVTALEEDEFLLSHIVRQGNVLTGTRPFWRTKSNSLQAMARFLSAESSPVFLTFSAADMQWQDLHRHFPNYSTLLSAPDHARYSIIFQEVQENPHIIAHYLDIRLRTFTKYVVQPFLGFTDSWDRKEWQNRGTGHSHGLYWIPSAPALVLNTDELRAIFARYWGDKITAWNPGPDRPPDRLHPSALAPEDVANTADQFTAFVNRFQQHGHCTTAYCLRSKKGLDGEQIVLCCRFHFPRPLFPDAIVTRKINCKSWLFSPARNQAKFNQCSPVITMGWMANTDIQPPTSLAAILTYIGKYVSKPEKSSTSYKELQAQILPYINDRVPSYRLFRRC